MICCTLQIYLDFLTENIEESSHFEATVRTDMYFFTLQYILIIKNSLTYSFSCRIFFVILLISHSDGIIVLTVLIL
ncbi:unknown [Ruminococcus sp. CAG:353]|nr:unknown [Ruminococcus sp. CAG:353]